MKNYSLIVLLLVAVLAFITLRVVVSDRSPSISPDVFDSETHKIDRLFYNMGIRKIPGIAPPTDINHMDLTGKRIRLSDMRGKIVFLNFWATWCSACLVEIPAMEKLNAKLKDKDFVMLAISMQEPASRVKDYFIKHKLSFTALLDTKGEVASSFGVISIPTTFIMDKGGGIIGKAIGAREWYSKDSISLFEYLL